MSIESVMPSNHLILCRPLLLLPSIFPSIRVFSNESALRIRWPKYWSFSFNNSSSNEYSELISFRMDWLDLPAVQGSLKSSPTPQFKSISSSAFSFPYVFFQCPSIAYSYPTLCDPHGLARQAPLSTEFFRQEHWSGLPFPSPGDPPWPWGWTRSPAWRQTFYSVSHRGSSGSSLCTE